MQWRQVGEKDESCRAYDIGSLRVIVTHVLRGLPPSGAALHLFVRDGVAPTRMTQILHLLSGSVRQGDPDQRNQTAKNGQVGVRRCITGAASRNSSPGTASGVQLSVVGAC